jgi:NAD(P)-dependent dehydrogenase (short-subunit alcohol dehydrogenase family)
MARTALITGGAGGLGTAVTQTFLDAGWRVAVTWAGHDPAGHLPQHEHLTLVHADLLDETQVRLAVDRAALDAEQAPLRAVVNLVGGFAAGGRVHETPVDAFEAQLRINLRPTYLVTAAAIPHLQRAGGGAIVCTSSRTALQPFAGAAGYVTAKAAVLAFVDALHVEYAHEGIRANAILPSVIDTPANRALMPDADQDRWVAPAEIAQVIRFLCDDESAATSGAHVPVYGRA